MNTDRGDRLRQLRKMRRQSQEFVAGRIGVSVKTLRTWESGGIIRDGNADKLAAYYGIAAEELYERPERLEFVADQVVTRRLGDRAADIAGYIAGGSSLAMTVGAMFHAIIGEYAHAAYIQALAVYLLVLGIWWWR